MSNQFWVSDVTFNGLVNYPQIIIKENITTFISGESGCGKTTLLKLLNGTVSPTTGIIEYGGTNIEETDTITLRKEIILVNQTVYLFSGTIEDNFTQYYLYREKTVISRDDMNKNLSLCCINLPLDYNCDNMSGGEKQRVFLAICVSFQPKVLMLDEPTASLDVQTGQNLLKNIKEYCLDKMVTLIIISHDQELISRYGDEIIQLERRGMG